MMDRSVFVLADGGVFIYDGYKYIFIVYPQLTMQTLSNSC